MVPLISHGLPLIICLQRSTNYFLSTGLQCTARPLEFIAYTEDSSDVVTNHDIDQHAYPDDNQLYTSCLPIDVALARQRLSECTADFLMWCAKRRLQLNASKTEALLVGSKYNIAKLAGEDVSLTIGMETIQPSDVVRDSGTWLDSELSLKQHVIKTARNCCYQLRRLRQVRRRDGREVTTRLVLALVMSRLDYCNSVLAGLPT